MSFATNFRSSLAPCLLGRIHRWIEIIFDFGKEAGTVERLGKMVGKRQIVYLDSKTVARTTGRERQIGQILRFLFFLTVIPPLVLYVLKMRYREKLLFYEVNSPPRPTVPIDRLQLDLSKNMIYFSPNLAETINDSFLRHVGKHFLPTENYFLFYIDNLSNHVIHTTPTGADLFLSDFLRLTLTL